MLQFAVVYVLACRKVMVVCENTRQLVGRSPDEDVEKGDSSVKCREVCRV